MCFFEFFYLHDDVHVHKVRIAACTRNLHNKSAVCNYVSSVSVSRKRPGVYLVCTACELSKSQCQWTLVFASEPFTRRRDSSIGKDDACTIAEYILLAIACLVI